MARPTRAAVNANNLKQTPIPVVGSRLQLTNGDGTVTRSGQLLLEQLQDVSGAAGGAATGPFVRTLVLYDLTPGAAIAPFVPIYSPGPGVRAIGVLRKTITADLKITITRNAESSPLFSFTLPHSTPIHTDVVKDISSVTFKDLDVLIPGITASDSSTDTDGVATLTIEWVPDDTAGSGTGGGGAGGGGGSGGGSGFTAGGDLAGSSTSQQVVGLEGIPLDATTVSAPVDGQVLAYSAASGSYKAVTPTGGGGGGSPPYISALIPGPDTTHTITGATHGFATTALLVQVYDNAAPRNAIEAGWTVNASTYDVIVTFATPQSNYYIVINGGVGPTGPAGTVNPIIGFVINTGATGPNIGPMLASPATGTVSKCVVVTKAADGSTALTFTIKKNGTSVFTTNPTVAAATASGTVSTFTALTSSPLPITAGDVFSIDITSGTTAWLFTAQLE